MRGDGDQTSAKRAPPLPTYLDERMKVARLVEALQQLDFNSRNEGKIVVDRIARNFLLHATRTAAADPDQTIHDVLARRGPVRR
jgi:hypothetical protein